MRQIQNITSDPNQDHTLILAEGPEFSLQLRYKEQQLGWFCNIIYGSREIDGLRIFTSGNVLHQWRNLLPFGIACQVEGDQEATLVDDFSSGRAKLFVLSQSEVNTFAGVVSGQVTT